MKKPITIVSAIMLSSLLIIPAAFAQQRGTSPGGDTQPPDMTSPSTTPMTPMTPKEKADSGTKTTVKTSQPLYANSLIGASVKNQKGENLGKIDELVIDPQQAQITTAIIAMGGVLGIGAKTVAVPWSDT
jgi:sporulation protein YlmC with PRC-barrel domain